MADSGGEENSKAEALSERDQEKSRGSQVDSVGDDPLDKEATERYPETEPQKTAEVHDDQDQPKVSSRAAENEFKDVEKKQHGISAKTVLLKNEKGENDAEKDVDPLKSIIIDQDQQTIAESFMSTDIGHKGSAGVDEQSQQIVKGSVLKEAGEVNGDAGPSSKLETASPDDACKDDDIVSQYPLVNMFYAILILFIFFFFLKKPC